MLLKVYNQRKELGELSGSNEKKAYLEKAAQDVDYEMFNHVLWFENNSWIKTNVGRKKLEKEIEVEPRCEITTFEQLMDFLVSGVDGTDASVKAVQNYIAKVEDDAIQEMLIKLVTKSNSGLGVQVSTINKAWEKAGREGIPVFNVMTAHNYRTYKKLEEWELLYVTLKMDGFRCVMLKKEGTVTFYTKSGKELTGFVEILEDSKQLPDNRMYDGELLLADGTGLTSNERFRETQKICLSKAKEKRGVRFYIFDGTPVEEFETGKFTETYKERFRYLKQVIPEGLAYIRQLKHLYVGKDLQKPYELLDKVLKLQQEGVMINNGNALYQLRRTNDILKLKAVETGDGVIKGFYEGKKGTKNEGKLGGIYITYKEHVVRVGGGFSDEEREEIWNNQEKYLGLVAEYEYTEESTNAQAEVDLRHARWKGIRYDKTEEDVNYDL